MKKVSSILLLVAWIKSMVDTVVLAVSLILTIFLKDEFFKYIDQYITEEYAQYIELVKTTSFVTIIVCLAIALISTIASIVVFKIARNKKSKNMNIASIVFGALSNPIGLAGGITGLISIRHDKPEVVDVESK